MFRRGSHRGRHPVLSSKPRSAVAKSPDRWSCTAVQTRTSPAGAVRTPTLGRPLTPAVHAVEIDQLDVVPRGCSAGQVAVEAVRREHKELRRDPRDTATYQQRPDL